jgi:hypothetical protein
MYKREFDMAARVLEHQEATEEANVAQTHETLKAQETEQVYRMRLSVVHADKATKLMDVRPKGPSLLKIAHDNHSRLTALLATTMQELAQARSQERFLTSEAASVKGKQAVTHAAALEALAKNIAALAGRVGSLQDELAQAQRRVDRASQIYAIEAKWFVLFQLGTPVSQRLRQNFGEHPNCLPLSRLELIFSVCSLLIMSRTLHFSP